MSLSRALSRNQKRQKNKEKRILLNKMKKMELSDFEYKADDPHLTLSAMGPQLVDFLNVVGLSNIFERNVNIDKRDSIYSPRELSRLFVLFNLLGIERIENSRILNMDQVLLKKLKLERIPDPQTLRDELARYDQTNLDELMLVNKGMLDILQQLTEPQKVDLHFDAKVITVYGDQEEAQVGYNPRYPGRKSYHLKVCTIAPFGFVLAIQVQSGKAVSDTGFIEFYNKCVNAVPQNHFVIHTVRLDSGFFSDGNISAFEADYVFFEVVAKKNPCLKKFITEMIPDKAFKPFNAAETIAGASFCYCLNSWDKPRDFVVVRKLQKAKQGDLFPKYHYQVICHNQPDLNPQEVWEDYNQRACCELNIRDLDYDHYITRVPSGDFESNFAWFWHSVLAYNLMLIFRLAALPQEWAKARTSTLRKKLFNIPGRLVNLSGNWTMHLMEGFPYLEVINYVKERLRWLFWRLHPLPA